MCYGQHQESSLSLLPMTKQSVCIGKHMLHGLRHIALYRDNYIEIIIVSL